MSPLRLTLLWSCLSSLCLAQALTVIPVPWEPLDRTIPHQAYNGHPTTLKAIARGGNGAYTVEWDFTGDGTFDATSITNNRYNLTSVFTYPTQAVDVTYQAQIRVTSNGQTVIGTYPVRIFADVPPNPALATDRQLQVMRNVAIDDGLWHLHNQMARSGNEADPFVGAQITGAFPGIPVYMAGQTLEALSRNRHFPAFPPAYLGPIPNVFENALRWNNDPYAEDGARLVNGVLGTLVSVGISAGFPNDESNQTGFYPEVTTPPIPGTDDGFGLFPNDNGNLIVAYGASALRGLAVSRLSGYVAQSGDNTRVLGRKFEFIIQQIVDAMVWAQSDGGAFPGSYYYTPNATSELLGEFNCGALDVTEALWQVERSMGNQGVIVPNLFKARVVQYLYIAGRNCTPLGGMGGGWSASNPSNNCEFSTTAVHLFALGWMGANTFSPSDARQAFPGFFALTRGQLRTRYDAVLTFMSAAFRSTSTGQINWDIGHVQNGDFGRLDGAGNHWGMVHWSRAARASEPQLVNFGAGNDYWRLFSQYFVNNQLVDGTFRWVYSVLQPNSDSIFGPAILRHPSALISLMANDVIPVVTASASSTNAGEGTALTFIGLSTELGTFTWDFGNGVTRTGSSATYSYPDDGTFTVTFTATTPGGTTSTATFPVTITNAAPVVSAGAQVDVNEGTALSFAGTVTDPGAADTFTVSWDFGDGQSSSSATVNHAYADDGTFSAVFTATDDDGTPATATRPVIVRNVAPTLTTSAPTAATEATAYVYTLGFTDPGSADTHVCASTFAPAGATFSGCTLNWMPTGAQTIAPAAFTVCVTDDDSGRACQSFQVTVAVVDTDNDTLPDSWEQLHFGNLSQVVTADPDADGLSNREELLGGTSPATFDGPSAPALAMPACNATVTALRPTLTVTNATDPQASLLRYEFELYDDAALTSLVIAATDVPAGATITTWRVPVSLGEDSHYWWRARANDGHVAGAWTMPACELEVDTVNALPGAPRLDMPTAGASVGSLQPTLVIGNAVDPENDPLTYDFEVYVSFTRVASQLAVASGAGTSSWQVTPALSEDTEHTWRVRAVSAGGPGPWSELGSFVVNASNTEPPAPLILSPQNGTTVETASPTLVFLATVDPDGDALTFDVEVAGDPSFSPTLGTASGLTESSYTVAPALTEDRRACWRVRAVDGRSQSQWVR